MLDGTAVPDFVRHIDARRRDLGVSQAALCRKAGLNEATYSRLLNGKVERPHAPTLKKLADALDLLAAEKAVAGDSRQAPPTREAAA
jgi:transcriptional regulator with XRE-family HTH domain